MSVNLKLFILSDPAQIGHSRIFVSNQLQMGQDYLVFSQLTDMRYRSTEYGRPTIRTHPLPPATLIRFSKEGEVVSTRKDGYNNDLTFAYAGDLKNLKLSSDSGPWETAIIAFINALPDHTPIILYWH